MSKVFTCGKKYSYVNYSKKWLGSTVIVTHGHVS